MFEVLHNVLVSVVSELDCVLLASRVIKNSLSFQEIWEEFLPLSPFKGMVENKMKLRSDDMPQVGLALYNTPNAYHTPYPIISCMRTQCQ